LAPHKFYPYSNQPSGSEQHYLTAALIQVRFVEFVLAPQHETSYDPETATKEDFDYLREQKKSSWKY